MEPVCYRGTRLHDEIVISELVTVHYFELGKDYNFAGEKHDFWELVYVDKGEISALAGDNVRDLKSGDVVFHMPNEWHTLYANGVDASSVVVISFKSTSKAMEQFRSRVFKTGTAQRTLISHIIEETVAAFDTPLSDLITPKLRRRKDAAFGSEQLLKLYLCEFLISFIRNEAEITVSAVKRNADSGLFGELEDYLRRNIMKKLSLDDIARYAGISKTAVKQLFRTNAGCGACEYFTRMKIDRAKTYIREDNFNFTQIAELLGYDSIHYFSRQFKQYVNMSPTEYAVSIRALTGEAVSFNAINTDPPSNDR